MTTRPFPGGFSYPPVTTQYAAVNAGALHLNDTTSHFNLNGPASTSTVDNSVQYILPGIPFDSSITPNVRLLKANLSSGGSAIIVPADYGALPVPTLADFRGIVLYNLNDFAQIIWTGFLWSLVDASPGVAVLSLGQTLP